jgi:hypothetical protein
VRVLHTTSKGWIRQFTVDSDRVNEYISLYESLGNQVQVEPMTPDSMTSEECAACLYTECDKYVIIFTRPREDRFQQDV